MRPVSQQRTGLKKCVQKIGKKRVLENKDDWFSSRNTLILTKATQTKAFTLIKTHKNAPTMTHRGCYSTTFNYVK